MRCFPWVREETQQMVYKSNVPFFFLPDYTGCPCDWILADGFSTGYLHGTSVTVFFQAGSGYLGSMQYSSTSSDRRMIPSRWGWQLNPTDGDDALPRA